MPSPVDTLLPHGAVGVRQWVSLGKNCRCDRAPRNLTRLWAFELDQSGLLAEIALIVALVLLPRNEQCKARCWFPAYSFGL